MKLQEAVRQTVLHVAQREAWTHPQVRVTYAPKANRVTISIAISGTAGMDVEGVLRRELNRLRDSLTGDARTFWPTIKIDAVVMLGATWTGTTVVRLGEAPAVPIVA